MIFLLLAACASPGSKAAEATGTFERLTTARFCDCSTHADDGTPAISIACLDEDDPYATRTYYLPAIRPNTRLGVSGYSQLEAENAAPDPFLAILEVSPSFSFGGSVSEYRRIYVDHARDDEGGELVDYRIDCLTLRAEWP